jgi:hypothetical protein
VRKLTIGIALATGAAPMMAGPAAAQDVVYHFEQRAEAVGAAGEFFTLPLPPGGPDGLMQQRLGVLSVEPFDTAERVTGAPYTADIVTDVVQTLADGNRIEHHNTSSVARDGQGRVRREQQLAAIGPILPQATTGRIVTIMNPVEGIHYSLDPVRKVAMRSPMPGFKAVQGGVARTQVVIGTSPFDTAQGRAVVTTDVDTIVTRRGPDPGRTEPLGTSVIEGVQAEGTRTVVTIPTGTIGNQAPIEMVSERWFSAELGVVVLSRRTDPRFGETTYRLQNIARGEPSSDLFEVPPDYTVEALPAFGGGPNVVRPSIEP